MIASTSIIEAREQEFLENLAMLEDWFSQYEYLLGFASELPPLPEAECLEENRLNGCTAPAWLQLARTPDGKMELRGTSDSLIVRAIMGLTASMIQDAPLYEIARWAPRFPETDPLRKQFAAGRRKGVGQMLQGIGDFARANR